MRWLPSVRTCMFVRVFVSVSVCCVFDRGIYYLSNTTMIRRHCHLVVCEEGCDTCTLACAHTHTGTWAHTHKSQHVMNNASVKRKAKMSCTVVSIRQLYTQNSDTNIQQHLTVCFCSTGVWLTFLCRFIDQIPHTSSQAVFILTPHVLI